MSQQADKSRSDAVAVNERIALLYGWLSARLGNGERGWLDDHLHRIRSDPTGRPLTIAVGMTSRKLGKQPLALTSEELDDADVMCPGLDLQSWSVDQAARVLFVLASFDGAEDTFAGRLDKLVRSAEIGEQVALLRGLPLYPRPAEILGVAGEGVRSAIQPVFEAVAHDSPYPAEHFSESMWNQMVVKTLFIGSRLHPIRGLDERRNADLARMLVDYAHERWAAKRTVSPELWRCVGPFAEGRAYDDLVKVFRCSSGDERTAAALALSECPSAAALVVLETAPTLWNDIRAGRISWDSLQ
jgi:hypothetical protein